MVKANSNCLRRLMTVTMRNGCRPRWRLWGLENMKDLSRCTLNKAQTLTLATSTLPISRTNIKILKSSKMGSQKATSSRARLRTIIYPSLNRKGTDTSKISSWLGIWRSGFAKSFLILKPILMQRSRKRSFKIFSRKVSSIRTKPSWSTTYSTSSGRRRRRRFWTHTTTSCTSCLARSPSASASTAFSHYSYAFWPWLRFSWG